MGPQPGHERVEVGGAGDLAFGFADDFGFIADEAGDVPGVEDAAGDGGDAVVADLELGAELDGVADDGVSGGEHAHGGFLGGVGIVAEAFAKDDEAVEVGFAEGHEVRVDVPAMGVAAVLVAEDGAGEAGVVVEAVDTGFEPIGADGVGVAVEQDDMVVAGAACGGFGGLAMAVAAVPGPVRAGEHADVGLGAEPGSGAVAGEAVDDDDLVGPGADGGADALDEEADPEEAVGGDGDDGDRSWVGRDGSTDE